METISRTVAVWTGTAFVWNAGLFAYFIWIQTMSELYPFDLMALPTAGFGLVAVSANMVVGYFFAAFGTQTEKKANKSRINRRMARIVGIILFVTGVWLMLQPPHFYEAFKDNPFKTELSFGISIIACIYIAILLIAISLSPTDQDEST